MHRSLRPNINVVAFSAIAFVIGCADEAEAPADDGGNLRPEIEASVPMEAGFDAAQDAASDLDSGSIHSNPIDAGPIDSDLDSGPIDATISWPPDTCGLSACPDPTSLGAALGFRDLRACCVGDRCGVTDTLASCHVIDVGASDEDCLDADLSAGDGGVALGCCRSDNRCGHVGETLGCHRLINATWDSKLTSCDGPPAEVPDGPFMCIDGDERPCTYDWECCGNRYAVQCSRPYWIGDAGPPICNTCPDC